MIGTIYIVTHKKTQLDDSLSKKGYTLISVGNGKNEGNLGVSDDTKENITNKNQNYCELTALYWIWKNDKSKYKGLCHYRRFITTSYISTNISHVISISDITYFLKNNRYDIILPLKQHFTRTVKKNFLKCGYEKDLKNLRIVINNLYPDYVKVYDKVLNSNSSYLNNMMIASQEIFDSYCEWLFSILFELEKITDLTGYNVQEVRIFGYLSERLLTVWVIKNKLKIKELPFINTEGKKGFFIYFKRLTEKLHIYQLLKDILFILKGKF